MDPPQEQPETLLGPLVSESTSSRSFGDPDGTMAQTGSGTNYGSGNCSTHAESLNPTRDDSYDNFDLRGDDGEIDGEIDGDDRFRDEDEVDANNNINININNNNNNQLDFVREEEWEDDPEEANPRTPSLRSEEDPTTTASSFSPSILHHSGFPSVLLLVGLVVLIGVALGTLAGFVGYYAWEKKVLDPLRPPGYVDPVPASDPNSNSNSNNGDGVAPFFPSDEVLLELFATVVGTEALQNKNDETKALDTNTPSGKAASWMLYEDPTKTDPNFLPRSDRAWIQRFVLAYTYYSTTSNGTTHWLSCNPPSVGGVGLGTETDHDETASCRFSYPTELSNGQLVYDLVPSKRWLSASDECLWGGVACGKTIEEETTNTTTTQPQQQPQQQRQQPQSYRAVTSVVLAGQNLKGSIATELLELPHLEILDLSHNDLGGSLHEDFRFLAELRLGHNRLSGGIPPNFFFDGGSSPLVELGLASNAMTGTLPKTLGLSRSLRALDVSGNSFGGTIPVLGNHVPLESFRGQNNLLTGALPFDYGYEGVWPATLREWWVHNNTLGGSLPENIGFLSGLEDLRVHSNRLTGTIPESIHALQRLFRLEAYSNELVGTIPEALDLPSLQSLRVQFNSLEGAVPPSLCFAESMEDLEADCLVSSDLLSFGNHNVFDDNDEAQDGVEAETIPAFASLPEAIAAARQPQPKEPSVARQPSALVQCYCCTKCCHPQTGDCREFSAR